MKRLDKDQKWRRLEDGTMELIEEIEVEREVVEEISTSEEIEKTKQSIAETNSMILELMETLLG